MTSLKDPQRLRTKGRKNLDPDNRISMNHVHMPVAPVVYSWYPRKPSKFQVMGSSPGEVSLFLTFVPGKIGRDFL